MPSASMNRLMDNAKVRLPGALETAIFAELFSVTKDFCNKSNVWKQEFTFDVETTSDTRFQNPDAYTYRIIPPTGSRSARLNWVKNADGAAVAAIMIRPDYIMLDVAPSTAQVYTAEVTLRVTDPVTRGNEPVVPDWIVEEYNDTLLDGVLWRMMSQAAKPYSSVTLAEYHARAFRSGISSARIASDRGRLAGAQAWRFPQSFNR